MFMVPVTHPAFTFRQPMQLGPLEAHVQGFVYRLVHGFPPDPKVEFEPPVSRLRWLVQQCLRRKIALAVDVESSRPENGRPEWGRLPGFCDLRMIGVGADIGPGLGMNWFWRGMNSEVLQELRSAMLNPKLPKVFTNGRGFDIPVMTRYGFQFRGPLHDIKQGRRALSSTSRLSLEHQTSIYTLAPPWKAEAKEDDDDEKGYIDASRISRDKIQLYNGLDCAYTAKVRTGHIRDIRSNSTDAARITRIYKQQLRLAEVASEMHLRGFPIDRDRQRSLAAELIRTQHKADRELVRALRSVAKVKLIADHAKAKESKPGPYIRVSFNGGVNERDLAALVYAEKKRKDLPNFGLEVPPGEICRTEGGDAAVNRRALLYLMSQDNFPPELKSILKAVWKCDAPRKARRTYVESEEVAASIGPDGRMHASFNSDGAETGRWTCSRPNLFNLSEDVEEEDNDLRGELPNVRDMYVAPPGYVIIHSDWKGVELEVMADVTKDKLLIDGLKHPEGLHTYTARTWFSILPGETVPHQIRKQAKNVRFACQYGASFPTTMLQILMKNPDADWEEIFVHYQKFHDTHVGILGYWAESLEFANTFGYNETAIMHRRRYYPEGLHLKAQETCNYRIQGTAADIANCTLVGIEDRDYPNSLHGTLKRKYPKAWIALHTYDSMDVIAPEAQAEEIKKLVEEKMLGPWDAGNGKRGFPVDISIGKRLSEV